MKGFAIIKAIKNNAGVVILCGICFVSAFIACYEDDLGETISMENKYDNPGEVLPIPGNSGIISASDFTEESISLAWARAWDEKIPQADLEYRVFRSSSSNIGTPDDAETNGTPLADWTIDATSINAGGLESGTTYYFNVVVRTRDGRKAAYMMVSSGTTGVIYMYSTAARAGNLTTLYTASARADIDKICSPALSSTSMAVAVPSVKNTRAFISINASDSIKNYPARYGVPANWPVKSATGYQIAWTWADMLDGSINMKLEAAGIASTFWWSGSAADGSYNKYDNCSGWTDGTNSSQGMTGAHNELMGDWLESSPRNCNNKLVVICVGW